MNVIRLTSTAELGSLEDLNPEKRMTVADIRSLRRKAHAQTQMKFSIARALANLVSLIKSSISQILVQRNSDSLCQVSGHTIQKSEDYTPGCRY